MPFCGGAEATTPNNISESILQKGFPEFLDLPAPAVVTLGVDFHDKYTLLKPFFN